MLNFLYFHEQADANLDVSDPEVRGATHTLDDVSETSSLPDLEFPGARAQDNLSFDVTNRAVLDEPEAQVMYVFVSLLYLV